MSRARLPLLVSLLLAGAASAQEKDTPDASEFPDASVGIGGAGLSSQETQDSSTACFSDKDCERGSACVGQKCAYRQYRDATFTGCSEAPGGLVLALALITVVMRRR